jgi:hypothetical protein
MRARVDWVAHEAFLVHVGGLMVLHVAHNAVRLGRAYVFTSSAQLHYPPDAVPTE